MVATATHNSKPRRRESAIAADKKIQTDAKMDNLPEETLTANQTFGPTFLNLKNVFGWDEKPCEYTEKNLSKPSTWTKLKNCLFSSTADIVKVFLK